MAVVPRHSQVKDMVAGNGDELLFGDFCFACGNSTDGTPYCSDECKVADAQRPLLSPEFSPAMSPVPLLVSSSAKSLNSSPSSSANNSPTPPNGIELSEDRMRSVPEGGEGNYDFPKFELPAVAIKFDYGGASLPNGLRYPSHFAVHYAGANGNIMNGGGQEFSPKEFRPSSFGTPIFEPLDLTRRRKPTAQVPAPLYFREASARVRSSPALGPSSPPFNARFSPRHLPTSPRHLPIAPFTSAIPSFALPPAKSCLSSTFGLPKTQDCGRPGCHGTPDSTTTTMKELLKKPHSAVPASMANNRDSAELILSPRVRALKMEDQFMPEKDGDEEEMETLESGVAAPDEDPSQHSAFACYLFSHLSAPAPSRDRLEGKKGPSQKMARSQVDDGSSSGAGQVRGRSNEVNAREEDQRSMSVDSVFPHTNHPSSSISRPARFFGGRGGAAAHPTPTTPITPGGLIPATTTSSAFTSPSASPYSSPPTVPTRSRSPPRRSRSRSERRRSPPGLSLAEWVAPPPPSAAALPGTQPPQPTPSSHLDPRGRSKLRGVGAVEREYSQGREESEGRDSRGRKEDADLERERGRGRNSASRSRDGGRDEDAQARGRRGRSDSVLRNLTTTAGNEARA